jgi:sulfur carrier protein
LILTVNGETHEAPKGLTLSGLVEKLGYRREALVAEVNRAIVPKDVDRALSDGDRIELIQFVGGG